MINNKYFNNILVVAGKKSFFKSVASTLIQKLIKKKNYFFFFKEQNLPEIFVLKKLNKKIISNLNLIIGSVNEQRLKNNSVEIRKKDIFNIIYNKI
jgi:hypothetical protein